jgi:hypothetical protein
VHGGPIVCLVHRQINSPRAEFKDAAESRWITTKTDRSGLLRLRGHGARVPSRNPPGFDGASRTGLFTCSVHVLDPPRPTWRRGLRAGGLACSINSYMEQVQLAAAVREREHGLAHAGDFAENPPPT